MKCARCAHQWRLLPEDVQEESAEEAAEHEEQAAPSQPAEHHEIFARAAAQAQEPEHDEPEHDEPEDDGQSGHWQQAAAPDDAYPQEDDAPEEQPAGSEPSWASRFSPGFGAGSLGRTTSSMSQPPQPAGPAYAEEDAEDEAAESGTGPDDDLPQIASWRSGREPFNASISTLSDPSLTDYGAAEPEPDYAEESRDDIDADAAADADWAREAKDRLSDDKWADEADLDDRVEMFGGSDARFQKIAQPDAEADLDAEPEQQPAGDGGGSWASRLMRLRQSAFGKRARSEPVDTEAEIRDALNSALEQQDDGPGARSPFHKLSPERFGGLADPASAPARDDGFLRFSEHLDRMDDEGRNAQSDRFSFGSRGETARMEEDGDEEPAFRLTGQRARAPIFGGARDLDADPDEAGAEGDPADRFESDLKAVFRGVQAAAPLDPDADNERAAYIETRKDHVPYDDRFGGEETERDPHEALNDDLLALQNELESTDVTTYERDYVVQGGGGLAVVAAWAVFVSVISGVILALITFRQDIMTALPGTGDLYQALGFEVPHAGVDFADVSYRWRTADGKPMIEVTGQVVNTTARTVSVPRVLVNVRDAGGGDAVKATATVPARELAPHQSASFSLEFLSPPADVAQIELAFDSDQ